jgi:hypothetical protein
LPSSRSSSLRPRPRRFPSATTPWLTKEASNAPVQTVHYKAKYKRYAVAVPRRCNWQCYPYWRPYQYRYWQFYYPYGGPLF